MTKNKRTDNCKNDVPLKKLKLDIVSILTYKLEYNPIK
jgi:hypothetical protein